MLGGMLEKIGTSLHVIDFRYRGGSCCPIFFRFHLIIFANGAGASARFLKSIFEVFFFSDDAEERTN